MKYGPTMIIILLLNDLAIEWKIIRIQTHKICPYLPCDFSLKTRIIKFVENILSYA